MTTTKNKGTKTEFDITKQIMEKTTEILDINTDNHLIVEIMLFRYFV